MHQNALFQRRKYKNFPGGIPHPDWGDHTPVGAFSDSIRVLITPPNHISGYGLGDKAMQ